MRLSFLLLFSSLSSAAAWAPVSQRSFSRAQGSALKMAIDYNDPVVAEEFNNVQPLSYDEVEEELLESGVRPSAAMNEMEVKLMLVEVRLRKSGKLAGDTAKKRPAKFSSKFEELIWTNPAFEEFYNELKAKDDHNSMNVVTEYINDPATAQSRYGKTYKGLLRKCEAAIKAPPPVRSSTIEFSGFPANMGEAACKMTLESIGSISEFECVEDDTFPILRGRVTFDEMEAAQKAVEQYHGMDMGMGSQLELMSV